MIWVTGDNHGEDLMMQLHTVKLYDKDAEKYLIVLGDFGLLWYPENSGESYNAERILDYLNKSGVKILFIDGNHENFERLNNLPEQEWKNGEVGVVRENVLHLKRGYVFNILDTNILTLGGAISVDKHLRTEWVDWWHAEALNYVDWNRAYASLDEVNWNVDYILTHATPTYYLKQINKTFYNDEVCRGLELIRKKIKFKRWYCGHYHMNKDFGKCTCLYKDVLKLGVNRG